MSAFTRLRRFLRPLRRNPGFTVAVLATLALGIGSNSAIFSLVNAVVLKPLPFPESERIVELQESSMSTVVGPRKFAFWRQRSTLLQDVSAHWLDHMNLTGDNRPALIATGLASAGFFHLYGAPILYGRTFTAKEDLPGGGDVVILSERIWRDRYASNPAVVGRSILLGDVPYTVIGVLGLFDTELFDQPPDLWVPFRIDPTGQNKDGRLCYVTARLKPGVTLAAARAQVQVLAREYERLYPSGGHLTALATVQPLIAALSADFRSTLLILTGAVGLVLLIACANIAGLLLARSAGRSREIAIHAALGATHQQLVRQLLSESAVLSLAGGALGLGLGFAGVRAFIALYPPQPLGVGAGTAGLPRISGSSTIALDWRVLCFTVIVSILASIFFGLIPGLQVSRWDLGRALKESGNHPGRSVRHTRMRSLLVIGEMAIALVLLIGASLLMRTLIALRQVNPGFDSRNVLTMQMSVAETRFIKGSGIDQMIREGIRRVDALPEVVTSAASCCLPLEAVWQLPLIVQGRPLTGRFHAFAGWTFVSPGYFEALHIPLLRGRTFTERDSASAPGAVIINQTLARRLWPDSDPFHDQLLIGRTLDTAYEKDPVRQIVGIVGDVRDLSLDRPPRAIMYVPAAQLPEGVKALTLPLLPMAWMIRVRANSEALRKSIQTELRSASGGLPVARIRGLDEVEAQSTSRTSMNTILMIFFAAAALLLASVGIYGLIAYSVEQRKREIGIRMALGAEPGAVRRMVMLQCAQLALAGTLVGWLAAIGLTRFLASLLYGVKPGDPISFLGAALILVSVALAGAWIPAVRASRVDPNTALQAE